MFQLIPLLILNSCFSVEARASTVYALYVQQIAAPQVILQVIPYSLLAVVAHVISAPAQVISSYSSLSVPLINYSSFVFFHFCTCSLQQVLRSVSRFEY